MSTLRTWEGKPLIVPKGEGFALASSSTEGDCCCCVPLACCGSARVWNCPLNGYDGDWDNGKIYNVFPKQIKAVRLERFKLDGTGCPWASYESFPGTAMPYIGVRLVEFIDGNTYECDVYECTEGVFTIWACLVIESAFNENLDVNALCSYSVAVFLTATMSKPDPLFYELWGVDQIFIDGIYGVFGPGVCSDYGQAEADVWGILVDPATTTERMVSYQGKVQLAGNEDCGCLADPPAIATVFRTSDDPVQWEGYLIACGAKYQVVVYCEDSVDPPEMRASITNAEGTGAGADVIAEDMPCDEDQEACLRLQFNFPYGSLTDLCPGSFYLVFEEKFSCEGGLCSGNIGGTDQGELMATDQNRIVRMIV